MRSISLAIVALLLLPLALLGQDKKAENTFKFVGTKGCKACHLTTKSGAAYKKWEAAAHSKAFETLASAEAKAIAKKKGIADPQTDMACLKCHETAAGVADDMLDKTFVRGEGVACESCHGPGSAYRPKKVMEDLYAGKVKPETVGLIKGQGEKLCVTCHNEESPTFKSFDYKTFYPKIAHEIPKAKE